MNGEVFNLIVPNESGSMCGRRDHTEEQERRPDQEHFIICRQASISCLLRRVMESRTASLKAMAIPSMSRCLI